MEAFHAAVGPDSAHMAWWQMCVRAVIIFIVGILYIRAVGPRTFARGSPLDIVISVVIGSNLSRALTGSAALLPTLAATAVLVALHWTFAVATRRLPWLARLVKGEPAILVEDGDIRRATLARQNISDGDFEEELRLKGVDDPSGVKRATLERSGRVSVVKAS